jgi:hypothetical protein
MAYCFASHAFSEVIESKSMILARWIRGHDTRFGYGNLIRMDGQCHVGINRAPLVVWLEPATSHTPSSLAKTAGLFKGFGLGKRNRGNVRSS